MNDTINRYLAILCYPFASMDFFYEDYFEEYIQAEGREEKDHIEQKLKKSMIHYVQENGTVYSYDEAYMYLEKCYMHDLRTRTWFGVSQLYLECFEKIMCSMISQRDGRIVFKYWKNNHDESFLGGFGDANKIFLFHSMNMHIPLDFIVMLYMSKNPENGIHSLDHYYSQIEVADQQLDSVLKAGVAENHLHKGVSISFFEIWETLMMPLASPLIRGLETLDISLELLFCILSAALVRVVIAFTLWNDRKKGGSGREHWRNICDQETEVKKMISRFERGKALSEFYRDQWGSLKEDRARHAMFLYVQKCWEELLGIFPAQQEGISLMRGILHIEKDIHTLDENLFLFYGMRYLEQHRNGQLVRCLLQYLRVKNYVFGCVVQKKTIRGLDYFQDGYYNKDSGMNKLCEKVSGRSYWEHAMRKQFQNQDLKKIEFRTSIDRRDADFRKDVRDFLRSYQKIIREDYCQKKEGKLVVKRPFPRVGLVYHLIKRKDETVPEKCYLDGLEEKERMQFGIREEEYRDRVACMRSLRREVPGLDRYIVGLDAASLENSTPVWVFSGVYENARDSSIEPVGYGQDCVQSLRFTFHAGEDFRHILSGLRRMDEAVTFLKFHAGDRIGHGIALGISPSRWKRANPFVVLPRIEALENYIWAYYTLSKDTVNIHTTLMAYLERRLYELAKEIYGRSQSLSVQALTEGYLDMFRETFSDGAYCRMAESAGFCEEVRHGTCDEIVWNGEKLARARHCRKFLIEMERPIHYEVTEQDIQITEALQKILRRKLSRKGIVVEINPSSNVAIGEVDRITDNQVYHLNCPDGEDNVMVCINSDDPTVFHTNVSNELAYIYYGMLYDSMSRETVLEWINKVRECGIKSSFLQGGEDDQQVYEQLEEIIQRL